MKWNSVDQALADLAYFTTYIKTQIPSLANSKVILVGGSYAATMVTWMRQKYPNLIAGAWASSAPLLAKADFFGACLIYTYYSHNTVTQSTLLPFHRVQRGNGSCNQKHRRSNLLQPDSRSV